MSTEKKFKQIKLVVTEQIIEEAEQKRGKGLSQNCPIALALRKAGYPASVGKSDFMIIASLKVFPLTETLKRYIRNFDGMRRVKPRTFALKVPK